MAIHRKKRTVVKANAGGKFVSPKTATKDDSYVLSVDSDAKDLARLKDAVSKLMPAMENIFSSETHSVDDRENFEALQELLKQCGKR